MKHRILYATLGVIMLLMATTALALAWPNQPPEKVLISGPGIEGQVEIKDQQALAIFRLGHLEDFDPLCTRRRKGATTRLRASSTAASLILHG